MQEYMEFASTLRKLLRRADRFGYDRQRLAEEVLYLAENYERVAEHIEMQMIVQMQKDQFIDDDSWADEQFMIDSDGYACNQFIDDAA